MKTDSQIQADVIQELKWDPSVTHESIGVSVNDGVATLSGTVPTYIEKWSAERAAQRVAGVRAVIEKIEVKVTEAGQHDDQDIANAIINQFKWNVQIPEDEVKVSVEDGWVDLSGRVEWIYQRSAAETCVRAISGVKGVTNDITIKEKEIKPDVIKQRIEDALRREAERKAHRIHVEVHGSQVVLSGNVHSFQEMRDARGAAFSAPGVTKVENNLRIE